MGGWVVRAAAAASAALLLLTAPVTPAPAATTDDPPRRPRIEAVLDASGSMDEPDASGTGTRLDAAKEAVRTLIDGLPAEAELGVRVYGSEYPGDDREQGCADTRRLLPAEARPGRVARTAAKQAVNSVRATGFTPIGPALRAAADDLGDSGPRRIILVSDGEDTCGPPSPCRVAEELDGAGTDLTVDTLGLRLKGAAERELRCVAEATGGRYTAVDDAAELSAALHGAFRRGWKDYQVNGTPVSGGRTCADAPALRPGRYLDTIGFRADRWYRYSVAPGQGVRIAATVVPEGDFPKSAHVGLTVHRGGGDGPAVARGGGYSAGWTDTVSGGVEVRRQRWDAVPAGDATVPLCVRVTSLVDTRPEPPLELDFTPYGTAAEGARGAGDAKDSNDAEDTKAAEGDGDGGGPGFWLLTLCVLGGLLLGAAVRVAVWRRTVARGADGAGGTDGATGAARSRGAGGERR